MKLFLDDVRDCPFIGDWKVARNYDEAVKIMQENEIEEAWLDHDLAEDHYTHASQTDAGYVSPNKTGYDFVLWMQENNRWPTEQCVVHSMNPVGSQRMCNVIAEHYSTPNPNKHYIPFNKLMTYLRGM
jgi:hypothetical protein